MMLYFDMILRDFKQHTHTHTFTRNWHSHDHTQLEQNLSLFFLSQTKYACIKSSHLAQQHAEASLAVDSMTALK